MKGVSTFGRPKQNRNEPSKSWVRNPPGLYQAPLWEWISAFFSTGSLPRLKRAFGSRSSSRPFSHRLDVQLLF